MSELAIMHHLRPPKTLAELSTQIQAKDLHMFHPMMGVPRAYMEIPICVEPDLGLCEGGLIVERWIYRVLSWWTRGSRQECEAVLCEAAWEAFIALRRQFAELYRDMEPLIVWRRLPEFDELPEQRGRCFEHGRLSCRVCERGPICRLHMRLCIPGLDLSTNRWVQSERSEFADPRREVKAEPRI